MQEITKPLRPQVGDYVVTKDKFGRYNIHQILHIDENGKQTLSAPIDMNNRKES